MSRLTSTAVQIQTIVTSEEAEVVVKGYFQTVRNLWFLVALQHDHFIQLQKDLGHFINIR